MVDIRIRKNERCVIGLPVCDYVFSSTRSCFIAYGFATSGLERDILRSLLEERGIEPVEAGAQLEPGKSVFCVKICSKIIVSQFCIVLANNDIIRKQERANANVNMEYGLILGHNKYVIPFQRDDQTLPFNVAGLDTIKYNQSNFRVLARVAIDQAIKETRQSEPTPSNTQLIELFLLINNATVANVQHDAGARAIFELGRDFGFNLLAKFDGLTYIFLGNFTSLEVHPVIWRLSKLLELLRARIASVETRVQLGFGTDEDANRVNFLISRLEIWLVVAGATEDQALKQWIDEQPAAFSIHIFTLDDVNRIVEQVPGLRT